MVPGRAEELSSVTCDKASWQEIDSVARLEPAVSDVDGNLCAIFQEEGTRWLQCERLRGAWDCERCAIDA